MAFPGLNTALLASALQRPVASFKLTGVRELEQSDVAVCEVTSTSESKPGTFPPVFIKSMDLVKLQARVSKPEAKWAVSIASYRNEAAFLSTCCSPQALSRSGLALPAAYWAGEVDPEAAGRAWLFVTDYLPQERWSPRHNFDGPGATLALAALARFHAAFWGAVPAGAFVFPQGAWWRKALRPSVKFERIPEAFASLCREFPAEFGPIDTPAMHAAMARLRDAVPAIAAATQPPPGGEYTTLAHGDAKPSNFLFSTDPRGPGNQHPGEGPVCLIDFQWTAPARSGLADVVYLLCGGIQFDALITQETELLEGYRAELNAALRVRSAGPVDGPSASELRHELDLELLDYWSTALPALIDGLTPQLAAANRSKFGYLTHEYDARVAAWACGRAAAALQRVGL